MNNNCQGSINNAAWTYGVCVHVTMTTQTTMSSLLRNHGNSRAHE